MKNAMVGLFRDAGIHSDHLARLDAAVRVRNLKAGEYLFHQGEDAPDIYFVTEGLAKMLYVTHDGKEFVKSFLPEGTFAGSLAAQFAKAPSSFSVVCIEPSRVEALPFPALESLFERSQQAALFGLTFFRDLALRKEQREYSFLCQSPQDRYRTFLKEHPGLSRRVSQGDLARYLGITPVALSRIRGRMKDAGDPLLE